LNTYLSLMRILALQPMLLLGTGRRVQFQTKRIGGSAMQPDASKDSVAIVGNTTTAAAGTAKSLTGWTKKFSETISREPFMNFLDTGEPGHVWSAGLQSTTIAAFREYISKRAKPGSQRDSESCNWDECALYACGYCETIDGTTYCPDTKMTDAGDGAILESEIQDFCVLNPEVKNAEFSSHSCREALKLGPGEVPPAVKHANQSSDDSAFSGENPTVMESIAAKPGESLLYKIPTTTKGHVMCSGLVFHFVPEKSSTPNGAFSLSMASLFPIISSLFIMNVMC
ncbi:hypothetical protein FOL47_008653, partial [Perkinsus chesapeaki]